ncbi:hypothetical protein TNCV_4696621 [Trichonephila clavipes]|nr:hypothetical protein TNCV_4696621 [Trichonephila clavipes]
MDYAALGLLATVSEGILTSHCSATRGVLAMHLVILNHGQVTRTTPELAPPLLTTTPTFELLVDLTCIAPLYGGSSAVWARTHGTPVTSSLPWPLCYRGHALVTDIIIFNFGQVMRTILELAPPLLTSTPTGGCFSLDVFHVLHLLYTASLQLHRYQAQTPDMPPTNPFP